jgi:hypothetical protein
VLTASGDSAVTAGGNLAVSGSTQGLTTTTTDGGTTSFGATTIGGALSATINGAISQSGALAVTGATTLAAGTNAITLDDEANDFIGTVNAAGSDVTLNDSNTLMTVLNTLGDSAIRAGGNLQVILDVVSGIAELVTESGGNIDVSGAASDLLISSAGATIFGATSISNRLEVVSAGEVSETDIAVLEVGGNFNVRSAVGNVALEALGLGENPPAGDILQIQRGTDVELATASAVDGGDAALTIETSAVSASPVSEVVGGVGFEMIQAETGGTVAATTSPDFEVARTGNSVEVSFADPQTVAETSTGSLTVLRVDSEGGVTSTASLSVVEGTGKLVVTLDESTTPQASAADYSDSDVLVGAGDRLTFTIEAAGQNLSYELTLNDGVARFVAADQPAELAFLENQDAILSIGLAEIRRQLGRSPSQLQSIIISLRPPSP